MDLDDTKSEHSVLEDGQQSGQVDLVAEESDAARDGDAVIRAKYFRRKYQVERLLAVLLLVLSAPLILLLIALVRLTSQGPGVYRQKRVGLHGEEFYMFKLRTMRDDAEADGVPTWCAKNDPRITRVGRVLRDTHLDELPQLWNVVRGEMSLTGPRPERPSICERLALHIDGYYRRTVVRPGVTGLSQINLEPDRTIEDVLRKQCLDLYYIENANAWLDVRMLTATVLRMFGLRGVTVMRLMGLCRLHVLRDAGLVGDQREDSIDRIDNAHADEFFETSKLTGKQKPQVGVPSSRPK